MRAILLAGANSGSGKTTVTLGLLKVLSEKMAVQPYKIGPDYVDTKFHSRITGRPSRNIDNFLIPDEDILKYLFLKNTEDVDIGVVEGVMGLYDGLGSDKDAFSTSAIAKLLHLPVILVVDGHGMSTSVAAIVKGYVAFDPEVNICGVIINNIMGKTHFDLIKKAVERYTDIPVIGYLPRDKEMSLPSRQLGLVPDKEIDKVDEKIDLVAQHISETVDVDRILELTNSYDEQATDPLQLYQSSLRIGIARDEAFNFYYADNLELMKKAGLKIVFFSPIHDQQLPEVDALYFGGGYPEEFARELSENVSMRTAIKEFSASGAPIYAECGGVMYLGDALMIRDDRFEMVGVLSGHSEMTPRLKKFGYCYVDVTNDCLLGTQGTQLVGHEFHHSVFTVESSDLKPVLEMKKVRDGEVVDTWTGGYQVGNTFASYLHIHFYQNKVFFNNLIQRLELAVNDS
ncbi:cobyrinic acid a,c-diamide synthase [Furfurilactobacillus siliginis]|uniref:Cobyrinate a,c-diamide synthase n=1 Tax=Furfurilactobacillus siliginis TaxID=348151 RepID=A0A0R2L8M3_9LACO|nr:cobyrinate a,c-diamide synthase [Furfurilactobacillus siliginis]KRN96181.1 cobyrinic acid a,c-diamide synthase [Furfurilactobacillus siliginis]